LEKIISKKVALTSSIAVILVYSYNEYMNRSLEDSRLIEKVNKIVSDRFPGFASRYFNHCMDTMTPNSLYNYTLDMTVFFRYLESIDYKIDIMTLKDLEGITPQVIEDYLEYVSTCKKDGITVESSSCTVTRRYSSLSSFFNYYYKLDMIDRNPVSKVSRPKPRKNPSEIPSNDTNLELLDYVINGELDGRKSVFREYTKERDIAIILLIMGAGIKRSDVSQDKSKRTVTADLFYFATNIFFCTSITSFMGYLQKSTIACGVLPSLNNSSIFSLCAFSAPIS